jgi:hypothetical protein
MQIPRTALSRKSRSRHARNSPCQRRRKPCFTHLAQRCALSDRGKPGTSRPSNPVHSVRRKLPLGP